MSRARHRGRCCRCGTRIQPGDEIRRSDNGWLCARCALEDDGQQRLLETGGGLTCLPADRAGPPIVFARTRSRKLMPIDSTIAVENAVERDPTATFEELREKLGADAVVSHFSTCPDADRFRQR